ncbi:dual oxidase maturation factor 1-like isoform X2 [Gigantopelta aegis]|uniref:dual oxidase maturation factor 1-like isoform X2 n=1 Tax=Gigantopelta aegis TaxID=1735272 RepID=UPI001B88D769|nr:dual oxidase maturation factor 1-like isoform X2 [Gigantopelta aegis]
MVIILKIVVVTICFSSNKSRMGLYTAFRKNGSPTFYGSLKTPFEADLIESGLIFCFVILAFSFFIVLPGIRGKEKLFTFIRITVSLYIGGAILLTNFSMTWETAEIHTETKYKAGTGKDINATIGLYIGLRGINITLKATPESERYLQETINYNEHFDWRWRQGRLGFGPFAGRFSQQYRAAQFRGLPLPILWVAEYFTFDGEGIRWGRFYRQAGWYTHILLWTALPLWVLTNILFFVLLRYGAYFLILTGLTMLTGNVIWATVRNFNDLKIPFTSDEILVSTYGGSFYVCLVTGVLCVVLGTIVFIMDLRFPQQIATFFSVDVLQDSEEIQVEEDPGPPEVKKESDDEEEEEASEQSKQRPNAAPERPLSNDDEIYAVDIPNPKRRSERTLTQRFQKNRRKAAPPPPPAPKRAHMQDVHESDEEEDYENAEAMRYHAQRQKGADPSQIELKTRGGY